MDSSSGAAEKQNKTKKKIVPWHYQQRYQASHSQRSLNYSTVTNNYKKKIKTLLDNNRNLARALERCRIDKENMAEKNNRNMDVIDISRIKLKEISENLKKVTACVDETYELLQTQVQPNSAKGFQGCLMPRTTFKKTLKAAANFQALAEVDENLEAETKLNGKDTSSLSIKETTQGKAKPIEKKVTPKMVAKKKDNPTVPKPKKQTVKTKNSAPSKVVTVRPSKSAAIDETPPSYLLGISSDSESFRNLVEQSKKAANPKTSKKSVQFRSTQEQKDKLIADDSVLNAGFLQDDLKETRKIVSKKKNGKSVGTIKVKKNGSTKKDKITSPQLVSQNLQNSSKDSWSTTDESPVGCNTKKLPNSVADTNHTVPKIDSISSQPNAIDTKADEMAKVLVPNVMESSTTMGYPKVFLERKDFMQNISLLETRTVSLNEIFHESEAVQKTNLKPQSIDNNSSGPKKKVGFVLEEEIETLNEAAASPVAQPKSNKTQKRPLKETTSNVVAPSKKRARSVSVKPPMEDEDVRTFVVTAEIHKPPDGFVPDDDIYLDKTIFFQKRASVVLTDIFQHQKNRILEKLCCNTNEVADKCLKIDEEYLAEQNSPGDSSDSLEMQSNKENKIYVPLSLEERKKNPRQRSIVPSYKEKKLNVKMRRDY